MIQANGKEEDTKSESLLRALLEALQTPASLTSPNKPLITAANEARWYLQAKDCCEFKYESGNGCGYKAVRVSFGIPCCEDHARCRDSSCV
jgi:hypothetical protein